MKQKTKEKKIGLQIIEMPTKNLRIKCNLHGIQKFVQVTKYGSSECEQCFEDIKEFITIHSNDK